MVIVSIVIYIFFYCLKLFIDVHCITDVAIMILLLMF